jgi:Chaperone required for the assembly of the mitochondrial F1-ATPase
MRRFWTEVAIEPAPQGHALRLDARPVRTPAKADLVVPTRALAEAVAEEWRAQGETVEPAAMPLTRAANAAIDRVTREREAVAELLAGYGETDLLCYRAPEPETLAARQAEAWDPLLDWAAEAFGARLLPAEGVMFVAQDADALARLARAVAAHDPWELTALHDLVTLSGSLVIGLAVSHGALDEGDAWARSRIDEAWNEEKWGEDAEAAARTAAKRAEFAEAVRLLSLLRAG